MPPRQRVHELTLGPFSGGINTYSDPTKISDNEVVDAINWDIMINGSYKSRPPWRLEYNQEFTSASGSVPRDCSQTVIGSFTYQGNRFVVFTSNHAVSTYNSYIYWLDGPNTGTITLIGAGRHSKAHLYANVLYLVPHVTSVGNGRSYNLGTSTSASVASMPTGYASVVYKDRLWISGRGGFATDSRLFFSALANFASWTTGTDFFDVVPGDGTAVQELTVYQDSILIFKDKSTHVLSYDQGPPSASLIIINSEIGASGPFSVVNYENSVFILKYNQVYEMVNYEFIPINVKIPFEFDTTLPSDTPSQNWLWSTWISLVGDRLIVRFYNRLYVYHLRLQAWTRWDSEDQNIKYIGPIIAVSNNLQQGFNTYFAGSTLTKNIDAEGPGELGAWNLYVKLFALRDTYDASTVEFGNVDGEDDSVVINTTLLTKQLDVGVAYKFKRLLSWGVDVSTIKEVTGTIIPTSVVRRVPWEELHSVTWGSLQSWQYPLAEFPVITQIVPAGSGDHARFIRFSKSIRFRLVQFEVKMPTIGNFNDGPINFYTLTAFVSGKQLVPNAVN